MARQRRPAQAPVDMPIPPPVGGLLTSQHCADLQDCLRSTSDTQGIVDCLTALGIDMSHVQREIDTNKHLASGLLHFFGPEQSVSGM